MAITKKLKFICQFCAIFCAGMTMANAQDLAADKHPEVLQLKSPCPVAKTFDSDNQPVYFWQYAFTDGVQDLAMAKIRPGEVLDAKRVTFGGSANPECHYDALAIARSGGSWGWHLAWLTEGSSILRYARMDGEAWVSSPTKKLSAHAQPAAAPLILTFGQLVWIIWYEAGAVNSIYAVFSDDEGRSWNDAKLIAETVKPLAGLQLMMKANAPYLVGQGIADGVP